MKFAILIVTIDDRKDFLDRLTQTIQPQVVPGVVIETLRDNGELTIGEKRQQMIESSSAEYVAFVDDDDLVSEDYVSSIMSALASEPAPDVVGFKLRYFKNGVYQGDAIHSKNCRGWSQVRCRDGSLRMMRTPNHLNPIRRELALSIGYKPMMRGEDADYSERLYIRHAATMSEAFIDAHLYDYWYRSPSTRKERTHDPIVEIRARA